MFKAKSPKFKLELGINELSNIPQVSGNCYIDLSIRDNKRVKSLPFKGFSSTFKNTISNDSDSKSEDGSVGAGSSDNSLNSSTTSVSQGNVSVTTSSKKIHNFKCIFNYNVSCNLRFGVKRRENLINDKYLLMRIYYVNNKSKEGTHHHHHHNNRLELGKLEINLSEYLNFNEPITSKYLLKDSKVNSILSLTIFLSELPADFDFHTQLTISDKFATTHHDSKLDQTKASASTNSKYNIPQFERKNVFGGLNDVIAGSNGSEQNSQENISQSSANDSDEKSKGKSVKRQRSRLGPKQHSEHTQSDINSNTTSSKPDRNQPIMIDPIINDLYKKILESTWDPKLHSLLEFSPEVCVSSIFDGSFEDWKQRLSSVLKEDDDDDGDIRCVNGLVNELNYRDDLKSWEIEPTT